MVKRRAAEDSDAEEAVDAKRARTSTQDDSDSELEEDDLKNEEDQQDEETFEATHEAGIRAAVEAKRKIHGGIAEHGIIESIEMFNFMCHDRLSFKFGPQINFIIGHNGSGKSAVLSAITVALGGKANSTGRGNGLKSFIKEGEGVAEVTISLKNQGEEAYRPEDYGPSILITRRFTKEGSSSWKIRAKDGRVISTKKDELSAICDHMNIQVDNPMNVLTQDAARQFLSASAPGDKYKFFLKGTQLSQLSDEYDTCFQNIQQTAKVLSQKKEALPDLRALFKEATARFEEASKAREQKKKADSLKKELAWSHVRAKEEEMTAKINEVAKMSRRLPKIEASIAEAEANLEATTEEVKAREAAHGALGDVKDLEEQRKEIAKQMAANKSKLTELVVDEKQMNTSVKKLTKTIQDLEENIAEEARRMQVATQVKADENTARLEEAQTAVTDADNELKTLVSSMRAKQEEIQLAKEKGEQAEREQQKLRGEIQGLQQRIRACEQQERDSLSPFGDNMDKVLKAIQHHRWVGSMPLGPFGMHIKIRDQQWADILRNQLGGYLTAFGVTDAKDVQPLKQILESNGNKRPNINIYAHDLFDYSGGEPAPEMLTVLRAIEVNNEHVLRILINLAKVEKTFLFKTRFEAEQTLRPMRGQSMAWTNDFFRVMTYGDGGGSSSGIQKLPSNSKLHNLFTGRNTAGDIQHLKQQILEVEQQLKANDVELHRTKSVYNASRQAAEKISRQERPAAGKLRNAKQHLTTLKQEINDALPADVANYQEAKEEAEAEKQTLMDQFADVLKQKAEIDADQRPLLQQSNILKEQINAFLSEQTRLNEAVQDVVAQRMEAQNARAHYLEKLEEEKVKVAVVEATARVLQEEFESWTAKAEEYCERVENPRRVDEVKRNLESVQKALKIREQKHGATVEEMTIEVNKAKSNLDSAERDFKQMTSLNKALRTSLIARLAKWQEFRRHIALRCKVVFQYNLSHRGYYGKVLFDHNLNTLVLKVQTDDQNATQGASRDKDPKSLSGGEKSFSTICLLLSLWESIGCPLRCLDEFDVFMDAVNRRISMKMMIDTANSSDKKQYVLITPQDMNNVSIGQTVRVHRMSDPERGQGVLAFS